MILNPSPKAVLMETGTLPGPFKTNRIAHRSSSPATTIPERSALFMADVKTGLLVSNPVLSGPMLVSKRI
jgi:hypothetical protein